MLKNTLYVLAILPLTAFAASCLTTGKYMPLKDGEAVIGTVQETLIVRSTFFFLLRVQDAINTESYIKLLEAAERKYPNSNIDIRDIVWVTGETTDYNLNTKIFVTGKVIRVGLEEKNR
jgi:hypothetical protein